MTTNEAKQELTSIARYAKSIRRARDLLAQVNLRLYSVRVTSYGERVSGATPQDNDRLERLIDRKNKIEQDIGDDILSMIRTQERLIQRLQFLPEPLFDVMSCLYIDGLSLERACVRLNYTYRHLTRIRARGVKAYSEKYEIL